MKTIIFNIILAISLLISAFILIHFTEKAFSTLDEFTSLDTPQKANGKSTRQYNPIDSFFEIDKNSNAFVNPNLTIDNTLGGNAGYDITVQNGITTFLRCTNNINNNGTFEFRDPSAASYPAGTTFLIDWGDGTTSNQVEDHVYSAGLYTLTYTVTQPGGTAETSEFRVFVGTSSLPAVIIDYSSEECLPGEYSFSVIVDNNLPGTTYRININDGSDPIILQSSDYPIGQGFTEVITHTFSNISCGTSSIVSGVEFTNAFSISVTASNPCSPEGNFNSVGPIRVSESTEADYSMADFVCIDFDTTIRDTSDPGVNTSASGCNGDYSRYWEISPGTFTLQGGSNLGNDGGAPEDWTSWNSGTPNLNIVFDAVGNYQVTLVTRNGCEESRITKVIEVIEPIDPVGVEALGPEESCIDETILLETDTKGATGEISWSADINGGSFDDASAQNPIYTPPNGYTGEIIFTMTFENDERSCESEEDTHTVIISGPLVEAGTYDAICANSTLALNGSFEDPDSTITWSSPDGGVFDDVNDPNTNFTPPEDFVGTLTLTIDINAPSTTCSENSASVEVEVLPLGEIDSTQLNDLEFCNNDLTSEIVFSSPNGSSFRWEIDENIGLTPLSGTGNLPSFTTSNPTTDPIEATVTVTPILTTNGVGCEGDPEEFIITVQPDPVIIGIEALDNYSTIDVSCFGEADGSITLSEEGAALLDDTSYDFRWTGPNEFTSSNPSLDGLIAGTYTLEIVEVEDPNECFFVVLEIPIEQPEALEVTDIDSTLPFCFGENDANISFFVEGGTPPYTSNSEPVDEDSGVFIENLGPGVYNFEIEDANGCEVNFNVEIPDEYINVVAAPTGNSLQQICAEDLPATLDDINANGLEIQWFLSPDGDQPLPIDRPITEDIVLYAKSLDRSIGCLSRESLEVRVVIVDGIPDINNYISVNENNLNENLNVVNIGLYPDNEMKIYNRYGKLVWETKGYNNSDNTFKGMSNVPGTTRRDKYLPTGTYYYILNYNSPCRGSVKKGFVQIDNNSR